MRPFVNMAIQLRPSQVAGLKQQLQERSAEDRHGRLAVEGRQWIYFHVQRESVG
jgi:hypothetical protein